MAEKASAPAPAPATPAAAPTRKLTRPTDGSLTVLRAWPKTGKDGLTPGGQKVGGPREPQPEAVEASDE